MDLSVLPTLYALTVFVVCFRPLVRRAGPHTNVWFFGWAMLLLHYIALLLPSGTGLAAGFHDLFGIWSIQLCALCFMAAASDAWTTPLKRIVIVEIGLPTLLQAVLYSFWYKGYSLRYIATLLLLVPAIHLLVLRERRPKPFTYLAAVFALLGCGLAPFSQARPYLVLVVILGALFVAASYLTLAYAPRVTRGIGLMSGGFFCWGILFPLQPSGLLPHDLYLSRAILDLPRYIVAAGMILSFLDEYVSHTESLALHDPLTGLPNRRLFDKRLERAIEESQRTGIPVACLVIDVDNFKWINDTHGHPVGDGLLRALSKRLSWNLGPQDILARTGGDEFTAVLVEAADEYHVRFIAGAMMAAGCVPVSIQHHAIDVHVSIGIAISPQDGQDSDELHKAADDAMYRAKRSGGGVVVFANQEAMQRQMV